MVDPIQLASFDEALKKYEMSIKKLDRILALVKMTTLHNPYYPLVRVMCRLELIKNWTI